MLVSKTFLPKKKKFWSAQASHKEPYTLAGPTCCVSPAAAPLQCHPSPAALAAGYAMGRGPPLERARSQFSSEGTRAALILSGAQPYLVGSWAAATVDPIGWCVGKEPCTQLVVKGGNLRLQAARAMLAGYRNPVRCSLQPALWQGGLRATEAGAPRSQAGWPVGTGGPGSGERPPHAARPAC